MIASPVDQARPLLAAVLEYGELPELLRAADILKRGLGPDVVFFFAKPNYRRLAEDGDLVARHGHSWIDANGKPARPDQANRTACKVVLASVIAASEQRADEPRLQASIAAPQPGHGSIWNVRVWSAIAGTITSRVFGQAYGAMRACVVDIINMCADYRRFRSRNIQVSAIVQRLAPSLVIVGQSAVGSELDMVLAAARRQRVPSLIVPFAMFNLRELAEFAANTRDHAIDARPLNRVLARRYPRWIAHYKDRDLLRLPGPRALALEMAGLVTAHPWIPCSAPVSAIACESEVAALQFQAMGLDRRLLKLVGGPVHDRLATYVRAGDAGRRELLRQHGLPEDRPVLLCGWPVNMFGWLGGRRIAYPDYVTLARAWATVLAAMASKHDFNVIVSAHPKTLDVELEAARAAGLTVVKGDTDRLVAHCDVFTTLNGSSITAWAIACGKPVVLFDCFGTGYTEFDHVPGLMMTTTEAVFAETLGRVCGDMGVRSDLARAQQSAAASWGLLDGLSEARLVALARGLLSGSEASAGGDIAKAAA